MMKFKIRTKKEGDHVRVTVFAGPSGKTKANCGTLCFRKEEWPHFEYMLRIGEHSEVDIEWQEVTTA